MNKKIPNYNNDNSYRLFKRLFNEYVFCYKKKLIIAVICMVIVAITSAVNISFLKPVLDEVFIKRNNSALYLITGAIVAVSIVKGVASYGQSLLMKYIGQRIIANMQLDLYDHLLHSDLHLINSESTGRLISRFSNDIGIMRASVSTVITGISRDLLLIISYLGIMLYHSWTLSIFTFTAIVTTVYPIMKFGRKMKKIAIQTQDQLANYTSGLDDSLQNIRIVKSFRREEYEIDRNKTFIEKLFNLYLKAARVESISSPIIEVISGIAIASIVAYSGLQVLKGATTTGDFFVFIIAFISSYKPIKSLSDLNNNLQEGIAASKRFFSIMDLKPKIIDLPGAKDLGKIKGKVEFKNVTFSYIKGITTLKDISFTINPGEIVAVVGSSGSGKSTVINLILRLYDPEKGEILIDDHDIKYATLGSLRDNLSIVTQDVILFDDTIQANIRYGRLDASDEDIIEAAREANAHDFIMHYNEGYSTIVGQKGFKLSGGQRQRLSLARAFLKNAPILLLDEATSALDQISERKVQDNIFKKRNKMTTIIVAHRLSTIINADKIIVLEKGEIVEIGSHNQLMNDANSKYYELYNKMQFADN